MADTPSWLAEYPEAAEKDWLNEYPEAKDEPFFDLSDTLSAAGQAVTGLPTTVPRAFRQLYEGLENPWERGEGYLKSQEAADAYQQELEAANLEAEKSGDISTMSRGMRQAGQSLGFSAGAMGAGLIASTPSAAAGRTIGGLAGPEGAVAGEIIGRGAGALASGYGAAYRMAGAQFLDDARKEIDAKFLQVTGELPNEQQQEEAYQELLPLAQAFGHAEAGPEAIGNLAMAGAGKYVFGLGRKTIEKLAASALGKTGAAAGALGTELAGETITGVEQNRIDSQKKDILEGRDPSELPSREMEDYLKSFKEVAPATLATMGLMSVAPATVKAASLIRGKPAEAAPTDDFAQRAAMEGAVGEATPVEVEGVVIATIPPESDMTPEDVLDFANSPEDMAMLARNGKITLPEVVAPVEGVDPAITDEMNERITSSAALAPQTVEALKAAPAPEVQAETTEPDRRNEAEAAEAPVAKQPEEVKPTETLGVTPPPAPTLDTPEGAARNADMLRQAQARLAGTEQGPRIGFLQSPAVTTATETPSSTANAAGGSQGVQSESAGGSYPTVTEDIVSTSDTPSTPVTPQGAAPTTATEGQPMPGGSSEWYPTPGQPATANINGQKVVGTVGPSTGKGLVSFQYVWNGQTQKATVRPDRLSSPVASLTDPPRYQYTQEQNTRKMAKHFPSAPGVHANHDFRKSFASMAKDASLSRIYRQIAEVMSKMDAFANMDLHVVADENTRYAGEYSHSNGKSAIAVNLRQVGRGMVDALGTILHEALHHVTLAKVRDPQGAWENEVFNKLDTIREKVLEYAKEKGLYDRLDYELDTVEEFISALTNPNFQNFLASIPDSFSTGVSVGKFRSVLSEVFRLIAEWIKGEPVARGSTMEQYFTTVLATFETPHRVWDTGKLEALNAVQSPAGYRSPTDMLAEAARKAKGETVGTKPQGLASMFNPQAKRPATGERKLLDMPQTINLPQADSKLIANAYREAVRGSSTQMAPLSTVYAQARLLQPGLTPETFLAQVQEGYDNGTLLLEGAGSQQEAAQSSLSLPGTPVGTAVRMMPAPQGTLKSKADDGEPPIIDIGGEAEPADGPEFAFTRARFAPPKPEDQMYQVHSDEEATKKAFAWINAVGPLRAADLLMADRAPSDMDLNVKNIVMGGLLKGFTEISIDPNASEDEKTVARATNQRLGKYRVRMNQDAARGMRQIGVQNGAVLQLIAPILAVEEVLADHGEKILEDQFEGGSEGAAPRVAGAAETATAEADERLENIIRRLMGSLRPKQTSVGALARMFRGMGQRDQIIDEVAKALMLKARGNVVAPERKTALANLVSSLKSTLAASVKGEKKPAPERTLQDLLTSAFVNQVSEGPAFESAWKEGRQKVLDMLIDMELDKTFHPAQKRLADLRAKLTYLEAGSAEQQEASAAERAQLADQIKVAKVETKAAMDAVKAMTPQLEAQRDALMPAAPTVAFDPVSSREAIGRAFEKAGYTADLATGLDKSGKRTLSIKDALLNRQRAADAVIKVFDAEMQVPDAATQNDWPQARALALKAVNETLDSWQAQTDADKVAKLEAAKQSLLSEDSKALEKLVNSIRNRILPDSDWSDILYDLPRTQAERLAAIKDRVAKHEALKNLTPDESKKLAESIDKLWQRERLKAFQDELFKAGVLKAKTTKAVANVASAAPELLRLMNLGVFNSSTFREAISKRFGLKLLTGVQADALRKLAAEAWGSPQGVLRNQKLGQLVEGIQHATGANWADVMNSYWIASVLSGLRTHFDTWGGVVNGLGTNLIQAGVQLSKGRGVAAFDIQAQWWKGLFTGLNEALYLLRTGDPSFTKRFEADLIDALNGEKTVHPIAIGEKMWKSGSLLQKIPGALMMVVGRSMVAADHVNNTATTQGAMAVARAMNPELYEGKTSWTQKEIADARKQAIAEATAGAEPATKFERMLVAKRTREILNAGLTEADQMAASEVGDIAAFQNDPTGLFGGLYHAVKSGLSSAVRSLDQVAQDEEAAKITRAFAAVTAGSVHALTGTRFMRFGFNLGNEFMRYMPGSWLLNKGTNILGSKLSPMQQDMLIGKNVVGGILLATLYSLFGDDDESEDGKWHMEGPWNDLSLGEQSSRLSAGLAKNSFWRRKDGKIERISYAQWPTAGLLAAVGSMLDEKRYKPEDWNQRGVAGHILQGAVTGLFQVQDAAAMQQVAELFSTSSSYGAAQGMPEKVIKMGTNYLGGLVPTSVKDLDKWQDPRNFRADGVWEKLVREMPVARRFVNDGRPQFNRIGQDVRLHREPYSRLYTTDEADKATVAYGQLLARGIDFPTPSTKRQIIKDGKKVPMDTLGKGVTYDFEKAVALSYGKFLQENGERITGMSTKALDKLIRDRATRILDIETRKVQAKVNNP
jgi:hypothetical protein